MKTKIPTGDFKPLQHNPFQHLGGTVAPEVATTAATPASTPPAKSKSPPKKAVVRFERKGRGGKEVTVIEQLGLRASELEVWCKALKQSLGCGGVIEGEHIVIQGDQRDRAYTWLSKRGVGKVIRGS